MRHASQAEQDLAVKVASTLQWDGYAIARVFAMALEDANFHSEMQTLIAACPELFEGVA